MRLHYSIQSPTLSEPSLYIPALHSSDLNSHMAGEMECPSVTNPEL